MSAGAVHIRIRRLAVDAAALGGASKAEFAERLERELAGRLAGTAPDARDPLIDSIAGTVSGRIADAGLIPPAVLPATPSGAKR